MRLGEEASLTALTCLLEPPRAERHWDLSQMLGKAAPFVRNVFEPRHIRAADDRMTRSFMFRRTVDITRV